MKKNCIIIHGCPVDIEKAMNPERRTYDKHWIPWAKKELIKNGIETEAPLMPEPWEPDYERFKKEFEKYKVNENTILVGHSCGCTFLVRWLEETGQKVNKLILVAPWKINDNMKDAKKEFYSYPVDKTIKNRVDETIIFTADNEDNNGKEGLKMFHEALNGEVVEIKGYGHYTMRYMETEEFPELLKVIMKDNN
jgi:predicted alpha/beta hydrolase family esterase